MARAEASGGHPNRHANDGVEENLDELLQRLRKTDGDPLRIACAGAGAWGSVFCALLQDAYGCLRDKAQVRVWRSPGYAVDGAIAEHLLDVINAREDVLFRRSGYLKYVEACLGDLTLAWAPPARRRRRPRALGPCAHREAAPLPTVDRHRRWHLDLRVSAEREEVRCENTEEKGEEPRVILIIFYFFFFSEFF
ncbi:hypothetical protein ACP4OV_021761 [Aristida adscensionis]